jgi:poly-gamma-glutamate synthesis protein (capsule biosynthesis protein)
VETRQALETVGVQYFGHYNNSVVSDICEVVAMPAKISGADSRKVNLPVAFCGYHNVYMVPKAGEIAVISKYSELMPTIVMPHMGVEYKPAAEQLKIDTFHSMVDAGADLVVGAHPHWVQNTEVYKDRLIVYSAGNFIFDQKFDEDVMRGAVLDVTLTANEDSNLKKWLQIGDSCKAFQDGCLALAKEQKLTKPIVRWQFDMLASQNKGLLTHSADEPSKQAVLDRTNWAKTLIDISKSSYYNQP